MTHRAPFLLAVTSLLACSPAAEDAAGFAPSEDYTPGVDLGSDTETGTWAMLRVSSRLMTDPSPLSSEQAPQQVRAWYRLAWQRQGTKVAFTEQVCQLESAEVFGAQTSFPAAYYAALGSPERQAELDGTVTGARFTAGPWIDVLGATLGDPAAEALPASADDARVADSDDDGQPGVTVHVRQQLLGEGDVYLAQRTVTRLDGVVVAPDRIEGLADAASEQAVLAASAWWLEMDTEGAPDPDPGHSYFIAQRVADDAGCEAILAARDALFGQGD